MRTTGLGASGICLAGMLAWTATVTALQAGLLPHKELVPTADELSQLARVRSLLATSTKENPNPVHIVFYGQSITLQPWWVQVSDGLRRLYPDADLTIENKAVSGFQDWALSRIVVADLVPLQPDLVIFHAYGNGQGTDSLLADLRSKTTAEVLVQSDHCGIWDRLDEEETDPSKIAPADLVPYRNYVALPTAAHRHGACLAHIHDAWKAYLRSNDLPVTALLSDGNVHLNDDGNLLMAEFVLAYLRPAPPSTLPDPWNCARVRTVEVGHDALWRHRVLECQVSGSSLTMELSGPLPTAVEIWVDGQRPSAFPELYGFSLVSPTHFANWPALSRVGSEQPLLEEEWTMTPHDFSPDGQNFAFSVRGSLTGPDGEGTNTMRFVSNSGRVVIEAGDHWLGRAVYYSGGRPVPTGYQARWRVERRFLDELPAGLDPTASKRRVVRLVQGLADGPHRLRLVARDGIGGGIRTVRAFSPAGMAAIKDAGVGPVSVEAKLVVMETPMGLSLAWPQQFTDWRLESSSLSGPGAIWGPVAAAELHDWAGWRTLPLGPFASPSFFRLVSGSDGAALPGQ